MKALILLLLGAVFGYWLAKQRYKEPISTHQMPNAEQIEQKQKNLDQILQTYGPDDEITNDKVQSLLGVANSSAERYLDELEKQGKLKQIGTTGKYVIYRKI